VNGLDLEQQISGPIQVLGMSFYFDPGTAEAAKAHNMNVYEFYGVGRGGVLGDVDVDTVNDAFWFFKPSLVEMMWTAGGAKGEPPVVAASYLEAAYAYADRTFGTVPESVTRGYADAARFAIDAVPGGRFALFDGYRAYPVPTSAHHAAYLATICFRELRGGVHIESTRAAGIPASAACFHSTPGMFKLHGYSDDDAPSDLTDLPKKMADAEAATDAAMASFLDVLTDEQRAAIAAGVAAFNQLLPQG
jgi:hypothetical protein